ncbi:Diels-Alderase ccsF, partial [Colletotrichum shisoi]
MRQNIQFFLLASSVPLAACWDYPGWSPDRDEHWTVDGQQAVLGGQMGKGREPVYFSTAPLDDPEAPKMLPLDSTGGEQWEFDAVSDDGTLTFVIGFYRDPNYAILGTGNLRLSAELAYSNGTRFVRVDCPTDSIVDWFTCLSTFSAVRIMGGPYAPTHVAYGSAFPKDVRRPSVALWEDGEHIFSATASEPSDTEDYAVLEKPSAVLSGSSSSLALLLL